MNAIILDRMNGLEVIIKGRAGAGKTEFAKILASFLLKEGFTFIIDDADYDHPSAVRKFQEPQIRIRTEQV
jgi:ATP-dependent Clp protease ATP-binding subunit ClpA